MPDDGQVSGDGYRDPAQGTQMNPSKVLGLCNGVSISVVGHIDINDMPQTQQQLAAMVEGMANSSQVAIQ